MEKANGVQSPGPWRHVLKFIFVPKQEYFTEDLSYYNETIEIGLPTSAEFLAFSMLCVRKMLNAAL